MKTLKIKKRYYKQWYDVAIGIYLWERVECRDYIIKMTEEEYFEYIRWKGSNENEK